MLRRRAAGFTLIELLITLVLMAILLGLAVPGFSAWIQNARMRTVAEALQNGVRTAQAESVRRNRQVVFSLTNDQPGDNSTAVANGRNWAIHTVPLIAGEGRTFVQGGSLSDFGEGVTVTGPVSVCFNSMGRLTDNSNPGVNGATCTLTAATPLPVYQVRRTGAERQLDVRIALGGQVRMCDPQVADVAVGGCQ